MAYEIFKTIFRLKARGTISFFEQPIFPFILSFYQVYLKQLSPTYLN